jgi:rhodanese-related sulfurtransferase
MSMFHGNKVPEVSAVDAESGQAGHILLDVRNADEWDAGHAPSAQWVPLRELEGVRFQLPMNRRIVCVCRSGARSARAVEQLMSWGFEAANRVGGMKAWAAAGFSVVRDDGSPGTVI